MTLPQQPGLTFGRVHDNDDVPDPELDLTFAEDLATYLTLLGPPPRQPADDPGLAEQGELLFETTGCASCHLPSLPGADGPVPLYSDLLLHATLPEGAGGIEEGSSTVREFRTPPLWGVSRTAPFMHDGAAETLDAAVLHHDGEARAVRETYEGLSQAERDALVAFLETL